MKKVLMIICTTVLAIGAYAYVEPTEKVLKSFRETFNGAQQIKWEDHENYFTVSFVNSGIRSKVNYDSDGNMMSSLRYYNPEMLPLNIFNKLKQDTNGKNLFGVTEVTSGTEVVYYVKVECSKYWTTLKVDATGSYEVVEKYKKA
ncbi:MAG: hypothetical protein QM731_18595 [Chitinophagaceae bacterium]